MTSLTTIFLSPFPLSPTPIVVRASMYTRRIELKNSTTSGKKLVILYNFFCTLTLLLKIKDVNENTFCKKINDNFITADLHQQRLFYFFRN
jgi:hypothetical protein